MGKMLQFPVYSDPVSVSAELNGLDDRPALAEACAKLRESLSWLENALTTFQESADQFVSENERLKFLVMRSEIVTQIRSARRLLAGLSL